MRARKPCVLARLIKLGWKVLFIMAIQGCSEKLKRANSRWFAAFLQQVPGVTPQGLVAFALKLFIPV